MHLLTKQDRSVYFFIKNLFSSYTFVNVEDGFPSKNLELPTISIEAQDIDIMAFELGNRRGLRIRPWAIDVFASNKDQRDEFGYLIVDAIENGIPVYDYDEGFPPDASPTQLGSLSTDNIRASIIRIFPDFTEKLYWRMQVTFSTEYNTI